MHRPALHLPLGLAACLLLVACGGGSEVSTGTAAASSTGTTDAPTGTSGGTHGGTSSAPTSTTAEATGQPGTTSLDCNGVFDCNDCGEALVEILRVEPVVLVVDKSSSMVSETWDADADPNTPAVTRWSTVHGVVSQFAADHEDIFALGLVLSPGTGATDTYDAAACQVAAVPDLQSEPLNAGALVGALPPADAGAVEVAGATPNRAALLIAYEHLAEAAPDGRGSVVLLTDGAANCSLEAIDDASRLELYDQPIAAAASTARSAGITTYVVGVAVEDVVSPIAVDGEPDATNNHERLGQLALAGGGATDDPQALYYNSSGEAELASALAAVVPRVFSCAVDLDPIPKYVDFVELDLDGAGIHPSEGPCGDEAGWFYTNVENSKIELCGALCAHFRETGAILAQYRCPHARETGTNG